VVERFKGVTKADDETRERAHRPGVLFSAGLITGEALVGILIAIPIVVSRKSDVLSLPSQFQFGPFVGLVVLAVVGVLMVRTASRAKA
jgi:uncharacterized integral membrane protein